MTKFPKRKHNVGQYTNFEPEADDKTLDLGNPLIKNRMDFICSAIENSVKGGEKFEDILKKVMSGDFKYSLFVWAYTDAYRKYTANRKSRAYKTEPKTDGQKIVFSGKNPIYMTQEEALIEIYNKYIQEKNAKESSGELGYPDRD